MGGTLGGLGLQETPMTAACGACGTAVPASTVLATADALRVCTACYTKAEIAAAGRRPATPGAPIAGVVGAIASAAPLVAAAAIGDPDWLALVAGVLAAGCGAATIVAARSRASGAWLAIGVLVVVAGAYHLARGLGITGTR